MTIEARSEYNYIANKEKQHCNENMGSAIFTTNIGHQCRLSKVAAKAAKCK
jgi:hypothetical protein